MLTFTKKCTILHRCKLRYRLVVLIMREANTIQSTSATKFCFSIPRDLENISWVDCKTLLPLLFSSPPLWYKATDKKNQITNWKCWKLKHTHKSIFFPTSETVFIPPVCRSTLTRLHKPSADFWGEKKKRRQLMAWNHSSLPRKGGERGGTKQWIRRGWGKIVLSRSL